MKKRLLGLLLLGASAQAQTTVTVTGDGAATVVTAGTQGPAGAATPPGGSEGQGVCKSGVGLGWCQTFVCTGGACSFTVPILAPAADNCAAPPFSSTGDPTTGFCSSAVGTATVRAAGTNRMLCNATACTFTAPILELRDGANAETFNVYNTYTDASNYERASLRFESGVFVLGSQRAGSGSIQNALLSVASNSTVGLRSGTKVLWWYDTIDSLYGSTATTIGRADILLKGVYSGEFTSGGKSQALTDAAAATPSLTIAVATNGWIDGELIWAATSSSGADQLIATGSSRFWGSATGSTPVCGLNKIGTDGEGHSGGANTLVCTWTNLVSTTNCALSVTCTNDLAGTQAITLYRRFNSPNTMTATFQ